MSITASGGWCAPRGAYEVSTENIAALEAKALADFLTSVTPRGGVQYEQKEPVADCKHTKTHTNEHAGTTWCSDCGRLMDVRIEE